jgi:aspartyl aminopeptidase
MKSAKPRADRPALDLDLPQFLDAGPSPYHAAAVAVGAAVRAGFQVLYDGDPWSLEAGRAYVVLHNGSTVAAFRMGRTAPADAGSGSSARTPTRPTCA